MTGWRFATDEAAVVRSLVALLVGLPAAWLVSSFFLALRLHQGIWPAARWLTTIALAAGTLVTSYSVTLNNHVPAAAFLFAAVLAGVRGRGAAAGALCGLTLATDIVPGLVFAPVVFALSESSGGSRAARRCATGLACGLLLLALSDFAIVGSVLPPKLVPGRVDTGGDAAANVAGVVLPERLTYPLECLFGGHGLFSVSPVLLFGLAGLAVAVRRETGLPRRASRLVAAGILVHTAGHLLLAGGYGGWSYGFRYLIPIAPLLLFFAPLALGGWRTALFVPVLAVSVLFAALGVYNPWPPAYESHYTHDPVATLVTNPIGANAAAWLDEHANDSPLAVAVGARFVSPDPALRDRYFRYWRLSRGRSGIVRTP
ncbi:MAG TPA: hypothetical protein VKF32_14755 [Thermoanaerobaculia bacterium]|nr:hypothetical protein [Thermoanaerobaculia bacterium]